MGVETFGDIDDLVTANPVDATDTVKSMAEHIRGIKSTLQTDFPSVTGPVTATQAELNKLDGVTATTAELNTLAGLTATTAELNKLDGVTTTTAEFNLLSGQEGAVILDGIVTAGGTADALTADFTPNVSLTNNVTVIVEAAAANATTTPTLAVDGLTAKTITKEGNQALRAGDIFGAGHRCIFSYDSGNDKWELLNPSTLRPAETNFEYGHAVYLRDDSADSSTTTLGSVGTGSWVSVGPTGSGLTQIWSALDNVPSNTIGIIVKCQVSVTSDTAGDDVTHHVYARNLGSSATTGVHTLMGIADHVATAGGSETITTVNTHIIHVDGDNDRFQVQRTETLVGSGTISASVTLALVGFVLK